MQDSPSPKRKKRKNSESGPPSVILGTTSGVLLVYSITKGGIDCTINSNTHSTVNCLSVSPGDSVVYSGSDNNILEWDLRVKKFKRLFKLSTLRLVTN